MQHRPRVNVGRLLEDISGRIDRNHAPRKGAHATAEQHRAWNAAHPEQKREANKRYRNKHRELDRLRARVLAIIWRKAPEIAEEAMLEAMADPEVNE